MSKAKGTLIATLAIGILVATAASAQAQQNQGGGNENAAPVLGGPQGGKGNVVGGRIHYQRRRIQMAVDNGQMSQEQAAKLNSTLDDVETQAAQYRKDNNGALKPEDFKQLINSLNQTSNQIRSFEGAGQHVIQKGDTVGAEWKPGPDGAQDPRTLIKQMKAINRRQMRQESQSNAQKIEQQQLQYEKEMLDKLGQQRQDILKQKDELQNVRKESGAD